MIIKRIDLFGRNYEELLEPWNIISCAVRGAFHDQFESYQGQFESLLLTFRENNVK